MGKVVPEEEGRKQTNQQKKTLQKLLVCLRLAGGGTGVKRAGTKSGRQRAYLADRCAALGSAPLSARLDHFHDSRRGETSGSQEERSRQEAGGAAAPLTLRSLYRLVPSSPSALRHKVSQTQRVDTRRFLLAPTCSLCPPPSSLSLLSLKSQGIITLQLHDSPPPLKNVVCVGGG